MASNSTIEWTGATWNPVTGCTKISPGCKNCYAECMAKRLMAMGQPNYANGFNPEFALGFGIQRKISAYFHIKKFLNTNSIRELFCVKIL